MARQPRWCRNGNAASHPNKSSPYRCIKKRVCVHTEFCRFRRGISCIIHDCQVLLCIVPFVVSLSWSKYCACVPHAQAHLYRSKDTHVHNPSNTKGMQTYKSTLTNTKGTLTHSHHAPPILFKNVHTLLAPCTSANNISRSTSFGSDDLPASIIFRRCWTTWFPSFSLISVGSMCSKPFAALHQTCC